MKNNNTNKVYSVESLGQAVNKKADNKCNQVRQAIREQIFYDDWLSIW